MKPQLPDEDIKILNAVKFHTKQYHSLSSEFINNKILPIIFRLQSALDEACRQRDEEMQYNPMSKSTKEMWRDRKNNQIKEILEGK